MSDMKKMSEPGCYSADFKQRVKSIFPDDQHIHNLLEDGSYHLRAVLLRDCSLNGVFVKQCLDDPTRHEELKTAANKAATAKELLIEWGERYRSVFWED